MISWKHFQELDVAFFYKCLEIKWRFSFGLVFLEQGINGFQIFGDKTCIEACICIIRIISDFSFFFQFAENVLKIIS